MKLLIKRERQKIGKIWHTVLERIFLANHLVKFLQDFIQPWRFGAHRVSTGH